MLQWNHADVTKAERHYWGHDGAVSRRGARGAGGFGSSLCWPVGKLCSRFRSVRYLPYDTFGNVKLHLRCWARRYGVDADREGFGLLCSVAADGKALFWRERREPGISEATSTTTVLRDTRPLGAGCRVAL